MSYKTTIEKCRIILAARVHREFDMNRVETKTFNAIFYRILGIPKKQLKVEALEPILDDFINRFNIDDVNLRLIDRRRIPKGNQGRYNV